MAINIQEILHPSDSDVIKFEKINYNFDQIVANGGGPTGPKGPAGPQGTPGFTGAKGEQGVKGEQGLTGATTSPWKVIPIDSDAGQPLGDGVNDYVILKPKQSTDNLRPIIFLGDETFDDENNLDGNITLRSTLTIGRHAVGVNNASDEYLTFWHGTNTLTNEQVAITLSSSEETDSVNNWTRFSLDKTYNSSNTSEVELRINLDRIKLEGHVTIGTAGSLLLNNTDLGAVMPSAGMIRYNSNSKTFQGGVLQSDNTTVQWIDFCMAPCGQGGGVGTIAIDPPGDLNLYSNGSEGEIGIDPSGDLELNNTGAPWGGNITYTVTYQAVANPSDIVGSHPNTVSGVSAGNYTVLGPTWSVTGYTFLGYDTYSGTPMAAPEYQPGDVITISGDTNLYARYEATATTAATTTPTNATSATTTPTNATSATTTPTNATSATTLATAATTLARQYTQLLLTPSSSVNEGNTVTVTANGNYIPNGTRVYVEITGTGVDGAASDFTGGMSSGAGSGSTGDPYTGGSGGGYADGVMLTFNNNTAQATLTVQEDLTTEGNETATFTMYAVDDDGVSTGSLSDSVVINDTSRLYVATFLGGSTPYSACTNPTNYTWSANYDGTTSDLITKMALGTGASYAWAEVQSDGGPNAINHVGYVFEVGVTSTPGQECSGVTTTTTTESGSGAGCNRYWIGNSSYNAANFYCSACGCDGQAVSLSGIVSSYNANSGNSFCSTLSASELSVYLQGGSGSAWIASYSSSSGFCAPGSGNPGAPS